MQLNNKQIYKKLQKIHKNNLSNYINGQIWLLIYKLNNFNYTNINIGNVYVSFNNKQYILQVLYNNNNSTKILTKVFKIDLIYLNKIICKFNFKKAYNNNKILQNKYT